MEFQTFFEAICWAIIGQQINLTFAYTVKRNLVEKFGKSLVFEGKKYFHFPDPETILRISLEEFKAMKFSKQKMNYIRAVSKTIVETPSYFRNLGDLNYEDAKTELKKLYGIGDWSAAYVLMKTFRYPQAFPLQDAGFQNALKKQLNLAQKPRVEMIRKLAKPWKRFEAYATFYLWRSLYE